MVRFSFLPPEADLNRRKILIDVKEVIFYFKVFLYLHLQTESSVVGRKSCYILEKAFTNALSDTRISQIRPRSREAAVDTYVYRQLVLSHFMCVERLPYVRGPLHVSRSRLGSMRELWCQDEQRCKNTHAFFIIYTRT
jgi:hypothetical protein